MKGLSFHLKANNKYNFDKFLLPSVILKKVGRKNAVSRSFDRIENHVMGLKIHFKIKLISYLAIAYLLCFDLLVSG